MNLFQTYTAFLKERFSLLTDKETGRQTIQQALEGSSIRGSNLWILLLAVVICSVGLNINATAVVIGAMLISPLMWPIIGVGVGLAIYDTTLIKKWLRNLSVAFILAIAISAIYFSISPLTEPTREIIARTSPTIWDIIIAFAGGLVWAIALTRKEKSLTYIPGVAIATALMPPLCVTGYRLVQWDFIIALKSFYLLFINSVFIAGATFLIAKILRLPKKVQETPERKTSVQVIVWSMIIITAIPSAIMTWSLIRQTMIEQALTQFSNTISHTYATQIIEKNINHTDRTISLRSIGTFLDSEQIENINTILATNGLLWWYTLMIRQGVENDPNRTKNVVQPLLSTALKDQETQLWEVISTAIEQIKTSLPPSQSQLLRELQALNPNITSIILSTANDEDETITTTYTIWTSRLLPLNEKARLSKWLENRLQQNDISIDW